MASPKVLFGLDAQVQFQLPVGTVHAFVVPFETFDVAQLQVAQAKSPVTVVIGQAVIDLLRPHKKRCRTLTFDNGKEFADHAFIGKCLNAKVYFARPYCSWERGLNENTNGLLR